MSDGGERERPRPAPEPLLLSVPAVGALLGISRAEAFRLLGRGELRSVRIGRRRLVPRDEIHRYVDRLLAESG